MYDCIGAVARTADRLYRNELPRSNDYLEPFLRSIVPASTLDDIQLYFHVNVTMSLLTQDVYNAHPISAYNLYWNKFLAAYTLFKPFFDGKQQSNPKGAIKLIQLFFVQGLQLRCVRDLMDRDKDISSFSALQARFEVVMTKIRQALIDNPVKLPPNNYNNNNNNRGRGNNSPRPPFVPAAALPVSPALGQNPLRPGIPVIPPPRPQYPNKIPAAGGARVNAYSTQ